VSTPPWVRAGPHLYAGALCAGVSLTNAARLEFVWAVAAVCAVASAVSGPPRRRALGCVALACAGWWWGSVRLAALDISPLKAHVGTAARSVVVVTAPARRSRYALRVPAEARRFGDLQLREPVLLELPPGRAPPQGAVLDVIATAKLPREARDGFDERTWLRRHGVHVVLRADRWRVIGHRGGPAGLADRLHRWLGTAAAPGLAGERRAVVEGVVLGEDEGLSETLRDRFRASGLYHLLAVSGQNVGLVAGGVLGLGWLVGVPRWLGHLAALAGIAAYMLAVGPQPSVIRAGIAGALASLAWLAARPRDRWYFLLLGALALLVWNPYTLLDPGFQLSFGAVVAIFVLVPRIDRRLQGYPLPRGLRLVLAVSAACGAATAPILWLQFHAIPLLTIPANVVAAPAMVPLLGLALSAAVASLFAPGVAATLAGVNGLCAAYLAGCARLIGGLPLAQVRSGAGLAAMVAAVGAGAALVRMRPRPRRRAIASSAAGLTVAIGWWVWPHPPQPPPEGLRITFLDVGQGDSALVQVPEGAVLVDQGPPEADVAGQLRRLGIRKLSLVVLTHPQRDHVGGAADVLSRLQVAAILDPRIAAESEDEDDALAAAAERHVRVIGARAGQVFGIGRLRLRVLWPSRPGEAAADPNDRAIVLVASYGEVDALLTADAESPVISPLRPPPVEILKVSHHGSADPGLSALLQQIRPRVAVISVGTGNDYGHPTPSTLAALDAADGLRVFRTDQDGRVVVESDGHRLVVHDER
jgi:competence protein ComEC